MEPTIRQITISEVGNNNGKDGSKHYIILNKKVYDVTGYDHPGGTEYFDDNTNDKYDQFLAEGHSKSAQKIMENLFIGNLVE